MPSPNFTERRKPEIKEKKYVKTVSIVLNPQDNDGESVTLEVDFFHNGDPKNSIFTNIHITSGCYGFVGTDFLKVHSTTQSFWGVGLEAFQKAFTHMEEVAYLLEKSGSTEPVTVLPPEAHWRSAYIGLESTPERKLARIKELIEKSPHDAMYGDKIIYDLVYNITQIVGANTQ